jgi:cardiolipin synthase
VAAVRDRRARRPPIPAPARVSVTARPRRAATVALGGSLHGVGLFDAGARHDRPVVVHDRVLTAANGITAVRLLGLPLFVWLMLGVGAYGIAAGVLAVVATTDWIDGYVARRFNQVTKLGRLLDPLIDRLLLAVVALTLLALGWLPWLFAVLVVGRDVVLLAAAAVRFRAVPAIPVSRMGKFATACLLIGIPSFLLAHLDWPPRPVFTVLAWAYTVVGVVTYYVAGWQYARAALRLPDTT